MFLNYFLLYLILKALPLLGLLDVKPEECLFVGDWPERDIEGAAAVGMRTCWAKYGSFVELCPETDFEINSIKQILEIITTKV